MINHQYLIFYKYDEVIFKAYLEYNMQIKILLFYRKKE